MGDINAMVLCHGRNSGDGNMLRMLDKQGVCLQDTFAGDAITARGTDEEGGVGKKAGMRQALQRSTVKGERGKDTVVA